MEAHELALRNRRERTGLPVAGLEIPPDLATPPLLLLYELLALVVDFPRDPGWRE